MADLSPRERLLNLQSFVNDKIGQNLDLTEGIKTLAEQGGGGLKVDTILKNGYVSVNSNYHKEIFSDISSYKCLLIGIFNNESIGYAVISVADILSVNPFAFGIGLNNTYVNLRITPTSIESFFYSGNWQDIKCSIYAYEQDILPKED